MSTAVGSAEEVSVTGATLGPRLRLPAGYVICCGTRAGLLLMRERSGSNHVRYELWDPGTQRVTRSFVNLIAASAAEIAWMPGCTIDFTALLARTHRGLPSACAGPTRRPGR